MHSACAHHRLSGLQGCHLIDALLEHETSVINQLAGLGNTPHTPSVGFQQVPVQGRYVLLHPPIHQKDPEPGDLLPVGFLRGGGCKQVNPNSYPNPPGTQPGGGPWGQRAYATRHCGFADHPEQRSHPPLGPPGRGGMARPRVAHSGSGYHPAQCILMH